jgi:hypothetical protein
MKKKLLFICTILSLSSYAQYFNHEYGSALNNETTNSGLITVMNQDGYLMGGTESSNIAAIPPAAVVSYIDNNGSNAGVPFWINDYWMSCPPGGLNAPPMVMLSTQVAEGGFSNFGVTGEAWDPSALHDFIYYFNLDAMGIAYPLMNGLYTCPGYDRFDVEAIIPSQFSTDYFITGSAFFPPKDYRIFVLRLNQNGNMMWGKIYDSSPAPGQYSKEFGFDIIEESPGTIIVAGMSDAFSGTEDGIILRVDPATGAPFNMDFYGTPTQDEAFTAIDKSRDQNFNYGYILAGYNTPVINNRNGWMLRIDNSNTVLWSNTYDYNLTEANDYWDVKERIRDLSGSTTAEYYACGRAQQGLFGNGDIQVEKVDVMGNPLGQFTYGTAVGTEVGMALDLTNNPNLPFVEGLGVFGTTSVGNIGGSDMTLYKTYFNGVTACKYYLTNNNAFPGPQLINTWSPTPVDNIIAVPTTTWSKSAMMNSRICFANTVTGGSNLRMTPTTLSIINGENSGQITAMLEHSTAGPASLKAYDMFGRLVYEKNVQLNEGDNQIPLDLGTPNISSGLYTINVMQAGQSNSQKVMITK